MSSKFKKLKEDFTCEHCSAAVKGTGYTNHCPICLWSKHVDINPGDREATCGGMMQPVRVETERGEHMLVHRCIKCGYEKRNRVSPEDDFNAVLAISKAFSDKNSPYKK